MRRTCSSIGPSDEEITASPPSLFELVDRLATADDVEGLESVVPAQVDDHSAQGRAGRRLEQPLSLGDGQDMPHHRQHGGRVDEEGRGLLVGDVVRDGPCLPSGDDCEFGPVSPLGVDHHDPLSFERQQPAEQSRPDLVDDADSFKAGRRRQLGQDAISTLDDHHVRRIDRTGNHPHANLAGPGMGVRYVADLQDIRGLTEDSKTAAFMNVVGSKQSDTEETRAAAEDTTELLMRPPRQSTEFPNGSSSPDSAAAH